MRITILGSGTSTGVPMVGCRCAVCTSNDPRDRRTRCSLLVEWSGKKILIDTSTDLRRQALREGLSHVDAVLFTHSHADHIHGIDDLRGFHFLHRQVIPCYGEEETMSVILRKFSYIFDGLKEGGYSPLLQPHTVKGSFELFGERVTAVPLEHGLMRSTGYRFGNVAYLTDCSRIPEESFPLLQGLDLLIIDGLRYTPHMNHFNIDGAVKAVSELRPRQAILTHLTHEVAYSDGDRLPAGVSFGYDGLSMEFETT